MKTTSSGIIRQKDGRDIVWVDEAGFSHLCEGTVGSHKEDVILWTRCQINVPRNAAYLRMAGEIITCPVCRAIDLGFSSGNGPE